MSQRIEGVSQRERFVNRLIGVAPGTEKKVMKEATIVLAVEIKKGIPLLLDTISDGHEISILEASLQVGEKDPLSRVYDHRLKQTRDDNEFSDYVENLLAKPFLKEDVQNHGVQWLKSRIRVEKFQKDEDEAAKIIANYAFGIFSEKMDLRDFTLAGPHSQVRVRVLVVSENTPRAQAS